MTGEPFAAEIEEARALISRIRFQLNDAERQDRREKNAYAREYYARNREQILEYQRQQRAKQREADPERYRTLARERTKRWRDSHKEQANAKQREKYHADPDRYRERRAKYYADNAEEIRARRRARYAANREKENAAQQARRDQHRRRREAGLPEPRLHPTPGDTVRANTDAANSFFERARTTPEVVELRKEDATDPEDLAAWQRDCRKARAAWHLAEERQELERLQKELGKAARKLTAKQSSAPTQEEIENARMDAVARGVNERLRRREQPRRPQRPDPAAPHPMLQPNPTRGMKR